MTAPAGKPARTAELARRVSDTDVANQRIAREVERPQQDAQGGVA